MKKAFLCIVSLLLLFSSSIVAQKKDRIEYLPNFDKKQLHFGYYLGVNKKTFKVSYNSFLTDLNLDDDNYLSVEESYGFNIGLIVDYKLHENINLRFEPGLSSNTKTLTYNYLNEEREVPGTYLRMPLLLKFSTIDWIICALLLLVGYPMILIFPVMKKMSMTIARVNLG
jgi:hypothetical protein